ncbi:hypothetical protein BG452_01100 [Streptomyces sp. CBMA123]|nr:hypothetical protein [Streptomyces sp. CBMA123]
MVNGSRASSSRWTATAAALSISLSTREPLPASGLIFWTVMWRSSSVIEEITSGYREVISRNLAKYAQTCAWSCGSHRTCGLIQSSSGPSG